MVPVVAGEFGWDALGMVGALLLAVSIFGKISGMNRRLAGLLVLSVFGSLALGCSVVAYLASRDGNAQPKIELSSAVWFMIIAGMMFFLVCFFRLLAVGKFGGNPIDIDFGARNTRKEFDSGRNMSFDSPANSFWHSLQGLLAVFLFPSVESLMAHCWFGLAVAARAASIAVVVYPVYNGLKRLKKHSPHFSLSSFFNNGFEWASGFIVGNLIGVLFTELSFVTATFADEFLEEDMMWKFLQYCRYFGATSLAGVSCLAAFQLVRTWDAQPTHRNGTEYSMLASLSKQGEELSKM